MESRELFEGEVGRERPEMGYDTSPNLEEQNAALHHVCDEQLAEIKRLQGCVVERIAAAAITKDGLIFTVTPPGRHHTVAHLLLGVRNGERDETLTAYVEHTLDFDQGFITSAGRFVDREEGWNIAQASGQILRVTGSPGTLFSEDLW